MPLPFLEALPRNARLSLRTFRRHPGAYVFAIAVLALGFGISTAVFSLVQAVLLRPLPFPHQHALRVIWKADRKANVPFIELAYPELDDLQRNVSAFESVAIMPTTLYGYGKVLQYGAKEPVQIESAPVSHEFFRTLGVSPLLGRDFAPSDEHVGSAPVAILSDTVWREQFASDRAIVGRQIALNGAAYSVIGVMAPAIDFPRGVGLWVPLGVSALRENRSASYLQAIARVRPGYSDRAVTAALNGLFQRLAQQYPAIYPASQEAAITSLPDYWVGPARLQLSISLGASFLLFATGAITASNLFLSRTFARGQEIATRISLGANIHQVVTQFVVEGALASLIATAAGLAIARALIAVFVRWAPADIPGIAAAGINAQVLLFAVVVSLLAAVACSAAPATVASRLSLDTLLREGSARIAGSRSGRRMQNAFTFAQTAITVVLLAASLLIVISVRAMLSADTGFENRDTLTMNLALKGSHSDPASRNLFYARLLDRLRASPSVASAAAVLLRPLEGTIGWDMYYQPEFDTVRRPDELSLANFEVVTPGYFQTVGTALLEGRDFTDRDRADSEKTVVIGRSMAARFRRMGHNPIGTRIRLGRTALDGWWKVTGVVADARYRSVTSTGEDIYVSYLQTGIPLNYLVIKTHGQPNGVAAMVRRQVERLDASQAIASVATIGQLIDRNTARQRFNMMLLLTFGLGALVLAAAGVYSVVAESVSVRKREIAIRLALGADRPRLIGRLTGATLRFVLCGELVGVLCAVAAGRSMSGMLYSISPGDPAVLGSVFVFLLAVSTLAAAVPAWVASGQQPNIVLKGE
jgi:putative ABC transport system permease protein